MGELPGHTLALTGHGSAVIIEYLRPVPTVRYEQPGSEVIEVVRANPRGKIVALDEDDSVLGVVYADDRLRAIEEETGQTSVSSPAWTSRRAFSMGPRDGPDGRRRERELM